MADWTSAGQIQERAARRAYRTLSLDAYAVTMAVAVLLVATVYFFDDRLGVGTASASLAFAIYAAISAIVLGNLHAHGHGRFGSANVVTTIRAAITAMIGGVVLAPGGLAQNVDEGALWLIGSVTAFALALDGIDGYLARRSGTASRFGARFDMEVDALLIFFLSLAAFLLGKAEVWVLLIGMMRYGYVAAQAVFPVLRGELPPSQRRKAICVVQGATLCLMLFPVVAPPLSGLLAIGALACLVYSFAVDVIFILRADRGRYGA